MEGDRGREAGRIGAGRVREAAGDGAWHGISKEAGDREKLRKILQHCITFYNRNRTEAGTRMEEGGKQEFKVREVGVSDPPVPLHQILNTIGQFQEISIPNHRIVCLPSRISCMFMNNNIVLKVFDWSQSLHFTDPTQVILDHLIKRAERFDKIKRMSQNYWNWSSGTQSINSMRQMQTGIYCLTSLTKYDYK